MRQIWLFFFATAAIIGALACKQAPQNIGTETTPDQSGLSPYCVVFDIAATPPPPGTKNATVWSATYASEGHRAQFRIELVVTNHSPSTTKGIPDMSFGHGKFVATSGSDAAILLRDLAKVLEAKTMPTKVARVATLPFEFVILGEHQSHAQDGGFFVDPKGEWTPMKIFLGPPGDEEGEVFLNLNPVLKKGEFSIKDPDYGDIVLRELAKVL